MAPRFTTAACCDILVASLAYCRVHKALRIYVWVILDNHFHVTLAALDLSAVLRDFKSFTAQQLIQQVRVEGRDWLLNQLHYYRAAHKRPNAFQVWQESSHPQSLPTDEIMLQKQEYLHSTPVKRGLVASPEH